MTWAKWLKAVWFNWNDWRVIYNDGRRTYRLRRSEAKSLKAIFGGQVVFDPL